LDINEVAKDLGKILLRAMRAHRHMPLARQWLKAHEEATDALSLIFVVKALDLPRFGWDVHPCLTDQLLARFVQTDLRMPCIIQKTASFLSVSSQLFHRINSASYTILPRRVNIETL
jgi:hypothetical protein